MGRYYIKLDAAGYKRVVEPGYQVQFSGAAIKNSLYETADGSPAPEPRLYNPPGSDWVMPFPHQMRTNWGTDPDGILDDYVLGASLWDFAPEITHKEWVPSKRAGFDGYAANKWISMSVPDTFTDIGPAGRFTALSTAIGADLPTGMGTVAVVYETPSGQPLNEAEYTPFLQWGAFPAADEVFCFGFADYVFLAWGNILYFLRYKSGSSTEFELLVQTKIGSQRTRLPSLLNSPFDLEPRGVMVLPVGPEEFWIYFAGIGSDPLKVKVRSVKPADGADSGVDWAFYRSTGGITLIGANPGNINWWIGAKPGQPLTFQVQMVGYDYAIPPFTNVKPLVGMGPNYSPTIDPVFSGKVVFRGTDLSVTDPAAVSLSTNSDGDQVYAYEDGSQVVTIGLRDETGAPWVSDGTHHQGFISLDLQAGNPGGIGGDRKYLAPQVGLVDLKFPTKTVARTAVDLLLDDTQWSFIRGAMSLFEADGKRFAIGLWTKGVHAFESSGLSERENYPGELWEDVAGTGLVGGALPETAVLRARFWVTSSGLTLYKINVGGQQLNFRSILAHGLIHRAAQPFEYQPQIVDPEGHGFIEHTFANLEVMIQSGIDVTDTTLYDVPVDPRAGTDAARLPGTWGSTTGGQAVRVDSPWAPDTKETRLAYADRLAKTWSAWNLYEDLTTIRYHPDLFVTFLGLRGGYRYFPGSVLYQSSANAVANGRDDRQVFEALGEREVIAPRANTIKVIGTGADGKPLDPHLDSDLASLNDPTSENYTAGEKLIKVLTTKLAIDDPSVLRVGRVALQLNLQRLFVWKTKSPLLPWRITPQHANVGRVFALEGLGDYRIAHLEFELLCSRLDPNEEFGYTQLVNQRVPQGSLYGAVEGAWPGIGLLSPGP